MFEPTQHLLSRADGACELCGATSELTATLVAPHETYADEHSIVVCATCAAELEKSPLEEAYWYCLQESAWSQVPAVQVTALRLLGALEGDWAADLKAQLYIEEDVLAWAALGQSGPSGTVDSNGTPLETGDSVTLIKDLVVKGAGFTAKRGTLVKSILVTDEPGIVEGRINRIGVVLKSCFLKKSG